MLPRTIGITEESRNSTTNTVKTKLTQNFFRKSWVTCPVCLSCVPEFLPKRSLGLCPKLRLGTVFNLTKLIPHSGHMPGPSCRTSGCMGQVYMGKGYFLRKNPRRVFEL